MKLTRRLFFANAATVIVPLAITVLCALAYLYILENFFKKDFGLENYQRLLEIRFELNGSQQSLLQKNPEIIEQADFHTHLQKRLAEIEGHVLILKNDRIIFSSRSFTSIDIAKLTTNSEQLSTDHFYLDNIVYDVELISVHLPDNSEGKVIWLSPLSSTTANFSNFLLLLGLVFLLSFALTNILVSRQLSKTIVKPLRQLQKAAAEISRGNLDNQIAEEGDREIQELCRDLEVMRLKLKELIHTQLKYEDNRKMLVSSISHDLKTPVTTIKGYIEGILDGVANTPEKKTKYLQTAYQKARQVDQMIDDLLLYARLDLKQMPFNFEKTDLAKFMGDFVAESEPEMEQRQIQLSFEVELSGAKIVNLDRERMKRVLTNILDNSIKYLDKPLREIRIILREASTNILIEIRDNGSGINERNLPHIFDRFYRADSSRSQIKGTGLGLAIAKQIVEGHGGRIWAVSHGSEGTSILISLRSERQDEKNSNH